MHLPNRYTHFDQDRQREEARKHTQHERNSAKELSPRRKVSHPSGKAKGANHIHVMVKSAEDLVIAVRDEDGTDRQPHHYLGEGLQAVQKIEIQKLASGSEETKVAEIRKGFESTARSLCRSMPG